MRPSLTLKIGQQLRMTPQLQQAIKLLQLSTLDLQQEIQEALDSNLMLEEFDDTAETAAASDADTPSPSLSPSFSLSSLSLLLLMISIFNTPQGFSLSVSKANNSRYWLSTNGASVVL